MGLREFSRRFRIGGYLYEGGVGVWRKRNELERVSDGKLYERELLRSEGEAFAD